MGRSSGSPHRVVRPAQYTDRVSVGPSASTAASIAWTRSGVAATPACRSVRAKPTSTSVTTAQVIHQGVQAGGPDPLDVLAVLEDRAQRGGREIRVEVPGAQRGERGGPVDRLGDAGRLDQVERRASGRLAVATWAASRSVTSGSRLRRMATSRSKSGCSTQW